MVRTIRPGLFVFLVLALFAPLFLLAKPAIAAECPAGTHPATSEDLEKMKAAGIPNPTAGMCWNSSDKFTGADTGEAKQYLRSIFRDGGKCSDKTPADEKIGSLNPTFAICAAKFLKAVRQIDSSIAITSAYRTTEHQRCLCGDSGSLGCAGAGKSNHQQGLALDLHARDYSWLHAQIRSFNGLRHLTIAKDPYHMEAIKDGPCTMPGYVPSDFTPTGTPTTFPGESTVRRILQPSFSAPAQSTAPATTQSNTSSTQGTSASNADSQTSPSTGTCSPQFYCTNSTYYYRTSTCVDQVYQKCQWGCASNGLCATATSSTSTTQTTGGSATSTYDLIGGYANLTQATTTPAPKEIPINPETVQATVLVPQQTPQGIVYVTASGQGHATQTFTSSDLSGSLPSLTQPASGFQATLNAVKQTVVALLRYLRPFGGAAQTREYAD